MKRMTELQAQTYLSRYILPRDSDGQILRRLVFCNTNLIDWNEVINILYELHPELNNKKYFENLQLV